MMAIHLFLIDPVARKNQDLLLSRALEHAGIDPGRSIKIQRAQNGKPVLDFDTAQAVGFSTSYARLEARTVALIALVPGRDIGLDVEIWPSRAADPVFLGTVASVEDARALRILGETGRDAGIALWVIKEAALKCTGEVVTDPRDLAVTPQGDDTFRVSTSSRAGSPHPEVDVALRVLSPNQEPGIALLTGVALAAGAHIETRGQRPIQISAAGWKLRKLRNFLSAITKA
jgi:phosphopantetheinyl transferase